MEVRGKDTSIDLNTYIKITSSSSCLLMLLSLLLSSSLRRAYPLSPCTFFAVIGIELYGWHSTGWRLRKSLSINYPGGEKRRKLFHVDTSRFGWQYRCVGRNEAIFPFTFYSWKLVLFFFFSPTKVCTIWTGGEIKHDPIRKRFKNFMILFTSNSFSPLEKFSFPLFVIYV